MIKQWDNTILLEPDSSSEYQERAVEFARFMGFQTEAAEFPVTSSECGIRVPDTYEDFDKYEEISPGVHPKGYIAASDQARPMPDFDWRKYKGLETLFTKGDLLADRDLDQLPDEMNFHLVLGSDEAFVLEAACNLAFRWGMEVTAYSGRLLSRDSETEGNKVIVKRGSREEVTWQRNDDCITVVVQGRPDHLVEFVSRMCEKFPYQGQFDDWSDRLQEMGEGLRMNTLDGQMAYADAFASSGQAFVDPEIDMCPGRRSEVEKAFPDFSFVSYKDEKKVYEKEYHLSWEVDDLKERLGALLEKESGENLRIDVAVSEDSSVRNELKKYIKDMAPAGADVRVYCSYKQGFSWVEDRVIPELLSEEKSQRKKISRVEIAFKPFLKPGETEWQDEDGATPSYTNVGGNGDPERWYDLPIRYLQELYPVEDILTESLGISGDDVEFSEYKGDQDITYLFKAMSEDGDVLWSEMYKAAWDERPYLDAYKEMGLVHPSTGYIRIFRDGELTHEERIETDVEKIWDVYQRQILPDIREYVDQKTAGRQDKLPDLQPFFNKLEIQVETSEPNERLKSREDLMSSLDGLHEDMYFVGTDYFKNYGYEKCGEITDAPGLILPRIRKVNGRGAYIKAAVYAQQSDQPEIKTEKSVITRLADYDNLDVRLKGLYSEGGKTVASLYVAGVPDELVSSYAALMDKGVLSISHQIDDVDVVEFCTDSGKYRAGVSPAEIPEKNINIRDVNIAENELMGYEEYLNVIRQLEHVKGLNVYRTARSYKGRSIYAVEFRPDRKGYVSRTKRITEYPGELITSRHHANEVSSTNSAFMLIKALLTDDKYRDLTEHMNLAIVPMENVDGAAIHYELQKDNPHWKFHVARFNAIGKEFYYDHFKIHTIHTEAVSLRRLFMRLLPDVIVDNHGVPSHEWEQQFSGYTSPSFKGFWLPRSLLYGYFFHIAGDEYRSSLNLCHRMEDVIADAFLADREITRENLMWARQFEKHAHGWMPKLFPASYYKNMITYWIPHEYDPAHRYPSVRYPWILSVDYVSEVADETAQGEYLHSCARAHLIHDLAVVDMLMKAGKVYDNQDEQGPENAAVKHVRKRPVVAQ